MRYDSHSTVSSQRLRPGFESPSPPRRALPRAARLLLLVLTLALFPVFASGQIVQNPISQFEVIVDGQFTGGVTGGQIVGEWSDVTPLAFISPPTPTGTLLRTFLGDPNANSLLYGALAPGERGSLELYLMYDYLPRTDRNFAPGSVISDIAFPITVGSPEALRKDITVQIRGAAVSSLHPSFFDVFVDIDGNVVPAVQFGIEGAVGFGPSTLSSLDHMLIELEVPLLIPPGFGPAFPSGGIHDGVYSPDPAFWGSNSAKNGPDPPATAAVFTINPNGSVILNAAFVPTAGIVPEPSGLLFGGLGLVSLLALARRRRK